MGKGKMIRAILNMVMVFATSLLLVFSIFAWYTFNKTARTNPSTGVSASGASVEILAEVIAVRYSLNGDITTNTYHKDSKGRLILVKSVIYTALTDTTETITEFQTTEYFVINEMLPGEHVDITIGYTIDESKDGDTYEIYLKNIVGDPFVIDGKSHYVTGAFRYKNISLKDENGDDVSDFTADTEYTWFNHYAIDKDDSPTLDMTILSHTWRNSYGYLQYTFSIYEDFTQYYKLIAQSENSYGNLLSRKNFNIGEIFLLV